MRSSWEIVKSCQKLSGAKPHKVSGAKRLRAAENIAWEVVRIFRARSGWKNGRNYQAYQRVKDHHKVDVILFCYIWVFFWNFESEKFSGETKNFQAKIKIGQAELMNGQVFKSTFRTLPIKRSKRVKFNRVSRFSKTFIDLWSWKYNQKWTF